MWTTVLNGIMKQCCNRFILVAAVGDDEARNRQQMRDVWNRGAFCGFVSNEVAPRTSGPPRIAMSIDEPLGLSSHEGVRRRFL